MQNTARDLNATNCEENSYQTVWERLERQKGNGTHKKQCATLERNSRQNTFKTVHKTLT